MEKPRPPRGTSDLMPDDMAKHRKVIDTALHVSSLFGFREMATPIFEHSDVFTRPLGESSDVVTKETYTFADRGGDSLTLRPEGTAPIARALISNGLTQTLPQKFFYHGPMFRYERPQKGRMRQFHQIGVEWFGTAGAGADADVIRLAAMILERLNVLEHCTLHLNSLGDLESRAAYRADLVKYLQGYKTKLSEDSLHRLATNPLRILDSKDTGDKEILRYAPRFSDYHNQVSKDNFSWVCEFLDAFDVRYVRDDRLVRGLDYYCHTAFEFITTSLGAQGTVLGGGRYNGLVQTLGGPDIPGVGWAAGIERLAMLTTSPPPPPPTVVLAPLDDASMPRFARLAGELRDQNIIVESYSPDNFSRMLKLADKINARLFIVLGKNETARGVVSFRDMQNGEQWEVAHNNVIAEIKKFIEENQSP